MTWLFKLFAKKYVLSAVNEALRKLQEKADVEKYRAKTEQVLAVVQNVLKALQDNKIDDAEADSITDGVTELFK